jgi:L-rhamnonate dehydratase
VLSNTNSPYAEFLTVSDGTSVRPIFDAVIGEPLPENGFVTVPDRPGFGVELNRDYLVPFG